MHISDFHILSLETRNQSKKQECIPIGCVPPACYPYLPACTALWGVPARGVPAGGVPASRVSGGVPARRGVPAQGVYLSGGLPVQVLPSPL